MGFRKYSSYTFEIGGHALPVPWEFIDGSELFKVSDAGLSCVLGSLTQDDSPENPLDMFDCVFVNFERGSDRPDVEEWKRIIRDNPGRVFTHSGAGNCHGPGTVCCGIRGRMTAKDTRGDKYTGANSEAERALDSCYGYIVVPSDVTDAEKYADAVLTEFSRWCNGEVYGVCIWTYTRDFAEYDLHGEGIPGEYTAWEGPDRDKECWGYIGYDYAEQELKEQFEATEFPKIETLDNLKQRRLEL